MGNILLLATFNLTVLVSNKYLVLLFHALKFFVILTISLHFKLIHTVTFQWIFDSNTLQSTSRALIAKTPTEVKCFERNSFCWSTLQECLSVWTWQCQRIDPLASNDGTVERAGGLCLAFSRLLQFVLTPPKETQLWVGLSPFLHLSFKQSSQIGLYNCLKHAADGYYIFRRPVSQFYSLNGFGTTFIRPRYCPACQKLVL